MPGIMLAVAAAVCWGLVYALDEQVLRSLSPAMLLFLSSCVSLFVSLLWLIARSDSSVLEVAKIFQNKGFILSTLFVSTLASYLILSSIQYVGAAHASILEISYPLFVVFFGYFLNGRNVTGHYLSGAMLVLIGSALVAYSSARDTQHDEVKQVTHATGSGAALDS